YQPMIDLRDGTIYGVEALVRWDHPTRGLLTPAAFVPLAEETGQITELGAWVLRQACGQAAAWRRHHRLRLAVNLSARQLVRPELLDTVVTVLAQTGVPPRDLCLEITESAVLEDTESALAALRGLRQRGVQIGIDDFGTGYASLSVRKRLP